MAAVAKACDVEDRQSQISYSDYASAPAATAEDATAANRHAREIAQRYWNRSTTGLALAVASMQFVAAEVAQGDSVDAQEVLRKAETTTDGSAQEASNGELPEQSGDWTAIQSDIVSAATRYKDALAKVSDAIDSGSSKDMADALDAKDESGGEMADAQHRLRIWYVARGGRADDVTDFQYTIDQTAAGLKSFLNAASQ